MNFESFRTPARRYVVSVLIFFGIFLVYAMRINLSVAVVSMTNYRTVRLLNGTSVQEREFEWNSEQKGYVLSSFFYGYVISEFPAGWLSKRFGGATTLGSIIICSSISTLLIPFMAGRGLTVIVIFRFITGIFEGGSFPSLFTIFSRWAPKEEKVLLLSLALTGPTAAMAICSPIYGVLAYNFGWRSLFYVSGIAGLLWAAIWFKEVKNDPKDDPKISQTELERIQNSVGENYGRKIKYPWKEIFTSLPVWAIIATNICEYWVHFTMITELPSFLNDVYKFDVQQAGILTGIPYVLTCVGSPLVGIFADYIKRNKRVSTTFVRKSFNSLCFFSQAAFLALVTVSPSAAYTMILFTLWMTFGCFNIAGFFANYLDVAPEYAGVIAGISNTFGCAAGSLGPTVAGRIVTERTRAEWNIVLLLCSVMYFFGATFYLIFASGNIQDWAKVVEKTEGDDKEVKNNQIVHDIASSTEKCVKNNLHSTHL